jgi:hypothetical protein
LNFAACFRYAKFSFRVQLHKKTVSVLLQTHRKCAFKKIRKKNDNLYIKLNQLIMESVSARLCISLCCDENIKKEFDISCSNVCLFLFLLLHCFNMECYFDRLLLLFLCISRKPRNVSGKILFCLQIYKFWVSFFLIHAICFYLYTALH